MQAHSRSQPQPPERVRDARSALGLVIERALRTRRERARQILDHVMQRVPHYRELPASVLDRVLEQVLDQTIYFQTIFYEVTLGQDRPMSADELAPGRETARSRARLGVPLGEYLLFFQEGLSIIVSDLVESAGYEARAELLQRLPRIISNQAQLMTALTEAYVEERERLSHFRDRDLYDFFDLLLHQDAGESVLTVRASALGISLGARSTVVLFQSSDTTDAAGSSNHLESLRALVARCVGEGRGWVGRSRDGFAAIADGEIDARRLAAGAAEVLGERARVGIGRPGDGPAGARRSAKEAQRALRIGAMMRRAGPVLRYSDVELLDLVDVGSAAAEGFMREVLGALADPDARSAHLETLRALGRHGYAIKVAAESLGVHPHTLSYRIKQIRSRYGIDVDDPDVRLRVQLALLIRDALAPEPRPRG